MGGVAIEEEVAPYKRGQGLLILVVEVVRGQKAPILLQHLGQLLRCLAAGALVAEHAEEVGRHQRADGPPRRHQRVNLHLRTAVAAVVGIGVLRQTDCLNLGTAAQAFQHLVHLATCLLPALVRGIVGALGCQLPHLDEVAVLCVEAARLEVGGCGGIDIVHNVPHHDTHNQQFRSQPRVAAPLVFYLCK